MAVTLALDVYGTLINTHGVVAILAEWIGPKANTFSGTWREKQLEYAFRRGLMQIYEPFSRCTSDALEYTCRFYRIQLTKEQKKRIIDSYLMLPAFEDVAPALAALDKRGVQMTAFSNGEEKAVESLLRHAGLRDYFQAIVSCDCIRTFKPDPAVYSYLMRKTRVLAKNLWLVSSNPFDVIGAMSAGLQAVWVKRSPEAVFDPWGLAPTKVVTDLCGLESIV
ncbi:haloacid dehalogenase type II [Microbulbifer spongiae]|uniref:(S)-2-haloacid dehalogenase n=1 Tax=Microbulbifer spongiae TaxID=2944933 RepID=A0ABY9EE03_9GAMM|nr:haloacid dehalogenase type II [Microbulbifer sp. MI-G]WKD51263.1 haloacid dehalogenase type II [Microbulbifer sp. MI-G]